MKLNAGLFSVKCSVHLSKALDSQHVCPFILLRMKSIWIPFKVEIQGSGNLIRSTLTLKIKVNL